MFCSVRNGGELEKGEKDYQNNICGPSQFRGLNLRSMFHLTLLSGLGLPWISMCGYQTWATHAVTLWIDGYVILINDNTHTNQ